MAKISDRIKIVREQKDLTQSELARKLGITRSSVNAWEQGISVPSTQYVIELSNLFVVSTDYLLGLKEVSCKEGLDEIEQELIDKMLAYFEVNQGQKATQKKQSTTT